jgi:phosphatidylserine/phosphatidylglycerophosphate/cardiolipin synthase-like enzyme
VRLPSPRFAVCLVLGISLGAMCAPAPQVLAQSDEVSPEDYEALREELRRHLVEYGRFRDGASAFEGVWTTDGVREDVRRSGGRATSADYAGELEITFDAHGVAHVEGKVRLTSRATGRWEGEGRLDEDGVLRTTYTATVGRSGSAEYRLAEDGSLQVTWESQEQVGRRPRTAGGGTCVRAFDLTREALEARIQELDSRRQSVQYPRPTPVRYQSRNVELRFCPSVKLDPDGVEASLVTMIQEASASIDVCIFELSVEAVARALVAAHERGVVVRVVHDDRATDNDAVGILREAGIPLCSDERSAYMHNKFLVVDGETVWTGSTNLTEASLYRADNNALTFRSAELAAVYTTEFEEMFEDRQFGVRSPVNTPHDWIQVDSGVEVQVYFAPEDGAMDRLVELVSGAESSVKFIAFAYTSDVLFEAMVERLEEGVEVSGIFESFTAGWDTVKVGPLHAAGARVRLDANPDFLHHKVVIIDDRIVCTGSFNLSEGADRSNDENLMVIRSERVARAFAREFDALMSITDPSDPRIVTSGMPSEDDEPDDDDEREHRDD